MPESWKGPGQEEGLQEGDLIMDYVMPVRGMLAKPAILVSNAVRGAASQAWKAFNKKRQEANRGAPQKAPDTWVKPDTTKASPGGWSTKEPKIIKGTASNNSAQNDEDWWSTPTV